MDPDTCSSSADSIYLNPLHVTRFLSQLNLDSTYRPVVPPLIVVRSEWTVMMELYQDLLQFDRADRNSKKLKTAYDGHEI